MKRPRRPVKKTPRKAVRKKKQTKAQKAVQAEAKLRVSLRQVDPYYLAPNLIPVGWAYQWKIQGAPSPAGWTCVPFSRHAHDFPAEYQAMFGQIAFLGLTLMEATADQVARESITASREASTLVETHPADAYQRGGCGIQIMPDDWVEAEKIPCTAHQNEGSPVDVAVMLVIRVPLRWNSAAEYLKLSLEEYVRRRISMERSILGVIQPFATEAIFEPVNLHFSPVNNFKES